MHLLELNLDCLLKIFKYCNERDLFSLCDAHPLLNNVIDNNIFYVRTLDSLMCGHRNNPAVTLRDHTYLSFGCRLQIARNWLNGCYGERHYFRRYKHATKLHLESNYLYISHACYLSQHKRLKTEALEKCCHQEITTSSRANIVDFVKKNDSIFVGRINGSCYVYEDGYATVQQLHLPKENLKCVDFAGNIYATCTDQCAKIWRREDELGLVDLKLSNIFQEQFKTLQFNNSGDCLFGGLYTSTNKRALREVCLSRGCHYALNSNTISVYDIKVKDDHTLLTSNFDTTLRLFDRRTDCDELIWFDPYDSSFCCLEYDGLHGVLCGAKYYSRVNLYDIRVPGRHMQLYFPNLQYAHGRVGLAKSSPVHSLACDSRFLFLATNRNVHVLDFKVDYAAIRDYRGSYRHVYRNN